MLLAINLYSWPFSLSFFSSSSSSSFLCLSYIFSSTHSATFMLSVISILIFDKTMYVTMFMSFFLSIWVRSLRTLAYKCIECNNFMSHTWTLRDEGEVNEIVLTCVRETMRMDTRNRWSEERKRKSSNLFGRGESRGYFIVSKDTSNQVDCIRKRTNTMKYMNKNVWIVRVIVNEQWIQKVNTRKERERQGHLRVPVSSDLVV